jgi:hypothetical protein
MSNQPALFKVCDKSKCVDIDSNFVSRLSNPSRAYAAGNQTGYEKKISDKYKWKNDRDRNCLDYNNPDTPYCYFLNGDKNNAEQWQADNMGLNKSSGNGNKNELKGCPGSTTDLPNYKIASYIFREVGGVKADDVYKLCKRDIIETNDETCCLSNDDNIAKKCPDGKFFNGDDCKKWRIN